MFEDIIAVILGVVCGVAASIPISLIILGITPREAWASLTARTKNTG